MTTSFLYHAIMFALPCWITNMSFVLARPLQQCFPQFAFLAWSLDGGIKFYNQPLFGHSRLFISFIFTLIIATLWWISVGHYTSTVLQIICTYIGTLLSSFIKRRLKYTSGKPLIVIDQIDYIVFVGIIWYFFRWEHVDVILLATVLTLVMQPIISRIGYYICLKQKPY